ncbi:MAG: homocysteine S-methyltransferase family protein [Desulfobacteraceae bacterium]|jgi:S-methylmethionine-dependent homocysteine/selenocysteine methylase
MIASERFVKVVDNAEFVLAEAAVCERLRWMKGITLHPMLFNTPLIYDEDGTAAMEKIYGRYRAIARQAGVPILLCAPTWRVNQERISEAKVPENINHDAVAFMQGLREQWDHRHSPVLVGGLMGPKNDCYRPEEGLSEEDALAFHTWQAQQLADTDVDVLLAQTMPALPEAMGMAKAMGATGLPYIISFVINREGNVFDGTPLSTAISRMDEALKVRPYGYMVNCVYPTFICADRQPASLFDRLLGIQANSSSKDQQDLDGSDVTQRDSMEDWTEQMLKLHRNYRIKILGGCCGTDDQYLKMIVEG